MALPGKSSKEEAAVDLYEDCAFVDDPPPELRCPLCRFILRDPFQSMCCGNLYCHCCIQQLVQRNLPCALCRGKLNLVFRDVRVNRRINSLRIKCPHRHWGCDWTGELGNLGQHVSECKKKPEKCDICLQLIPNDIIVDHKSLFCPKRVYTCAHCKEYTSTYNEVRESHWPVCPMFPLLCPNECSSEKRIPRKLLMQHLAEECEVKLKMKKMAETIDSLQEELNQRETRIKELEAQVPGKSSKSAKKRPLSLHSDKDKLMKENEALKKEMKVKDDAIAELTTEKSLLRTNLTQLEEDFHDQLKAMQTLCQTIQQRNDFLETQLKSLVDQ